MAVRILEQGSSLAGPESAEASVRIPYHVRALMPYAAGKPISELAREQGLSRIVKLASNENPLGPSPKAIAAAQEALSASHRYVDPRAYELTHALATQHGRGPDEIVVGAGTDSLIQFILTAFTVEGDEIVTAAGTFIGIFVNARKLNRKVVGVSLREWAYDLDAIARSVSQRTRIVYLANPNNPTGTAFGPDEFHAFMRRLPCDTLVILDEAYVSYARRAGRFTDGVTYDYSNVIVTRTFSKDAGLAGLRVGYAVGPAALMKELFKVRLPFEPSYPAQMAAIAALSDAEFLERTLAMNTLSLTQLAHELSQAGFAFPQTAANFLLLLLPDEERAVDLTRRCLERGLILRHTRSFGVPTGVRINSGSPDETSFACETLCNISATHPELLISGSVTTPVS